MLDLFIIKTYLRYFHIIVRNKRILAYFTRFIIKCTVYINNSILAHFQEKGILSYFVKKWNHSYIKLRKWNKKMFVKTALNSKRKLNHLNFNWCFLLLIKIMQLFIFKKKKLLKRLKNLIKQLINLLKKVI